MKSVARGVSTGNPLVPGTFAYAPRWGTRGTWLVKLPPRYQSTCLHRRTGGTAWAPDGCYRATALPSPTANSTFVPTVLAHRLQRLGVGPETACLPIGLERSKIDNGRRLAGNSENPARHILPLDPSYPSRPASVYLRRRKACCTRHELRRAVICCRVATCL